MPSISRMYNTRMKIKQYDDKFIYKDKYMKINKKRLNDLWIETLSEIEMDGSNCRPIDEFIEKILKEYRGDFRSNYNKDAFPI